MTPSSWFSDLRLDRPPLPLQPGPGERGGPGYSQVFDILRRADVIYLEIRQPEFWREENLQAVLFPIVEIILAAFVFFLRFLIIKNLEYRERIEEQRSLVTLGRAASTLAHEIKNPLLAIRLQTSIIARTIPGKARQELSIIDSEVERLSMITNRMSDFLRDPVGNPTLVHPVKIASEVGERLCGRTIVSATSEKSAAVRIDPERLRSILENLVRNALESGGDEEAVFVDITKKNRDVCIDVLDRGKGIPPHTWIRYSIPSIQPRAKDQALVWPSVTGLFLLPQAILRSKADRQAEWWRASFYRRPSNESAYCR